MRDIDRLVKLHLNGRPELDELRTRKYRLNGANETLAALASGRGGRGVILMD